jgi:hypothetical protein
MNPLHKEVDARFSAGDFVGALRVTEFGLAKNPFDLNLYRATAKLHQVMRNPYAAERWYTALIDHSPPRYADFYDRSSARNEQCNYPGVIEDLNRAELIRNDDVQLYLRRGGAYWEMNDWAKADADFKRVLQLDPNHPEGVWVRGLLDLQQSKFGTGWPRYEARWRSQRFKSNRLVTQKPQWSPNSKLRRVLVWGEQGIGDQILYASMLPVLRSMVDKVTMLIDPRLIDLFRRSMPDVDFLPNTSEVSVDEHDSHLPIASIGAQFVHSIDDIEKNVARSYLRVDPNKIPTGIPRDKPIIGISWTSNAVKIGPHKSIPIDQIEPLLSDKFTFVNLQYVKNSTDKRHPMILPSPVDCLMDLDGLASLVSICDCVVSVSSSTVHMAAAVGRPVLLMDANKLWYWGNRDENNVSYWYPSVKIFPRDHVMAPWGPVVRAVRDELNRRF